MLNSEMLEWILSSDLQRSIWIG